MLESTTKREATTQDQSSTSLVSEYDIYSFNDSIHYHCYKFLGAHRRVIDDVAGVQFTLWAPGVTAVSVVASFNLWRVNASPMTQVAQDIWTLWLPNLESSFAYQYALHQSDGSIEYINDPYASEVGFAKTASLYLPSKFGYQDPRRWATIVSDLDSYAWNDQDWIDNREASEQSIKPISVLEIDLEDYQDNYQILAKELLAKIQEHNYTHIQLNSVIEDWVDLTKSLDAEYLREYQFYAPKHSHGAPEDFKCLVDYCHRNNIGMVLELPIFAHKHDLSQNQIRNLFISCIVYWLEEFHIDGFKFDTCNFNYTKDAANLDFIQTLNETIHKRSRGAFTIIEDDMAHLGSTKPSYMQGLGFNIKLSRRWQQDISEFFKSGTLDSLTLSSSYAFAENHMLKLSSEDLASLDLDSIKILLAYMFTYPGKKFISDSLLDKLESGSQSKNTHLEEYYFSSPCIFLGMELLYSEDIVQSYISDLNSIYSQVAALHSTDFKDTCFEWIDFSGPDVIAYQRWSRDYQELVLVVINLSNRNQNRCQIGVAKEGFYQELLNSDALDYGGDGLDNADGLYSSSLPCHNRPYSLVMDIAARSVAVFRL